MSSFTEILKSDSVNTLFDKIYGSTKKVHDEQKKRYSEVAEGLIKNFKTDDNDIRFFSSPGRSEISGNHTDHNLGKVLAASIQMDCIGAVKQTTEPCISIYDLTYKESFSIDLNKTTRIKDEKGSIALVRGIIQGFKDKGLKVGGFKGCFSSTVIAAAGVSSSASFEMMICVILSTLYNNSKVTLEQWASIGQFAENKYWDKSSGQLDQMGCAAGGLVTIDFKNPDKPKIEKISFDFSKENHKLLIINTGKSHEDLSQEYSSIPKEMKSVAKFFKKDTLSQITQDQVIKNLPAIRKACGDRAVMRAFHFFEENKRVEAQVKALKDNDFPLFLSLIKESGNSSWKYLQNVYVPTNEKEQSISVCLALSERFIAQKKQGSCRIHGGGFAGVILVVLPDNLVTEFKTYMESCLGHKKTDKTSPVYVMGIRPLGSIEIK